MDILNKFFDFFKQFVSGYLTLKKFQVKKQKIIDEIDFFTKDDIKWATKYFVPAKFQRSSPAGEEGSSPESTAKHKIIPYLISDFTKNSVGKKYYLVLADTGLGKTTFLINLFLTYKNKFINFMDESILSDIKLLSLADPETLEKIEKIENPQNVILLLDAFDEDITAVENHELRLKSLITKTKNFRKIILTCRTQFFLSETDEPNTTGLWTYGNSGQHKFEKLYISTFDDKDIKKYLRKRFPVTAIDKRIKAKKIIAKCPNLMIRPMLLSYIEDLLDSTKSFQYTFQIYQSLIAKWIIRESQKRIINEKYSSEELYQHLLYEFSQSLAVDIYKNFNTRKGYFATKDKTIINSPLQLNEVEENMRSISKIKTKSKSFLKGKSLLNRSADGKYRFSHKSILEYFLARELIENISFIREFDFAGMDFTRQVYNEMLLTKLLTCEGEFSAYLEDVSKNKTLQPVSDFSLEILNGAYRLILRNVSNFNPLYFASLDNLEELIIIDELNLFPLYLLYDLTVKGIASSHLTSQQMRLKEIFNKFASQKLNTHIANNDYQEIKELLNLRQCPSNPELKPVLEKMNKMDWFEKISEIPYEDRMDLLEVLELTAICEASGEKLESFFASVNSFFERINLLQKKLPNCRIIC